MGKKRKPKVESDRPEPHDRYVKGIKGEMLRRGLTNYRIAQDTGISNAALSRFMQPGGTLSTENLFTLLDYLGIELVNAEGKVLKSESFEEVRRKMIESEIERLKGEL